MARSVPADARVFPSGLNDTEYTIPPWRIGSPICWREPTSQRRTVPSSPPEASVLPSGLNATVCTDLGGDKPADTGAVGPPSAPPIGWREVTSQRRTVPSPAAEARVRPSELNATA